MNHPGRKVPEARIKLTKCRQYFKKEIPGMHCLWYVIYVQRHVMLFCLARTASPCLDALCNRHLNALPCSCQWRCKWGFLRAVMPSSFPSAGPCPSETNSVEAPVMVSKTPPPFWKREIALSMTPPACWQQMLVQHECLEQNYWKALYETAGQIQAHG